MNRSPFRLLGSWEQRLDSVPDTPTQQDRLILPRSRVHYASGLSVVSTGEEAEAMTAFAEQQPLAWIGFDTEFSYRARPVDLPRARTRYDIRSIEPQLLSLAFALQSSDGADHVVELYRFVVDLRQPVDMLPAVRRLLHQPVTFVAHNAKAELFCLWQLGLPEPGRLWDTYIAEKAAFLGRFRLRTELAEREQDEEDSRIYYGLEDTCRRHGIEHEFGSRKEQLQRSFLDHTCGAPFSTEQLEYAAEDAAATARLYAAQVPRAQRENVLDHLVRVEMPWVVTTARLEWTGIAVDSDKRTRLRRSLAERLEGKERALRHLGVSNYRSHKRLLTYFAHRGIARLFREGGGYRFDEDRLKEHREQDRVIGLVLEARKYAKLLGDGMLREDFVGTDGRVHPEQAQLQAVTGRQSTRHPNVNGLPATMRPLVIPRAGFGIGEVDYGQIEVAVAASVYGDAALIELYNEGDVYCAMAKRFYRTELGGADLALNSDEFKRRHGDKRGTMKTCTLGIIFGLTAHGLARKLGRSVGEALQVLEEFLSMFPTLRSALQTVPQHAALRGFAQTAMGLRRYRPKPQVPLSSAERRWMVNLPVQGTAAALFKEAGNRLDKHLRRRGAYLLLALHDSFVFEAPVDQLEATGILAQHILRDVALEWFPALTIRVDLNIEQPQCWNKDGDGSSLDQWLVQG